MTPEKNPTLKKYINLARVKSDNIRVIQFINILIIILGKSRDVNYEVENKINKFPLCWDQYTQIVGK